MNSRYLLDPTNSPPDLRNHYCGRGHYSPSPRAVGSTLRGVVPSGTESSRKPTVLGQEFLRYAPNKFTQQCIVQVRFWSETLHAAQAPALRAVARQAAQAGALRLGRTSSRSGATVSRIMRARSWSRLCLESSELLLTSNMLYGRRTLFPCSNSFSKHKLLLWKGIVS